jgi:type VI secretion system protein ImpG
LRHEYPVIPDVGHRMGLEIYSIDAVTHTDATVGQVTEYQPFYSYRHGSDRENQKSFWYARRRPSFEESDRGTEVYLSFVNLDFRPEVPEEPVVVVHTTCTNRDLPGQLQQMGERLYLELEAAAPHSAIHCIHSPTRPLRPPLHKSAHWRLLSHLNLNHLSLTSSEADPGEGLQAFQEILRLYDFSDPQVDPRLAAVTRQLIEGITELKSRPIVERVRGLTASGFCRGLEVALELDDQKYVGTGTFLFACVLERFLGLYVSMNSFTKLKARTKQGEGYFKTWAPRAGEIQLL